MGVDGSCSIESVPVPIGRPVATIVGTIDELLAPDAHVDARDKYVKAVLTDATYVVDAKARLQERYLHCTDVVMQSAGAGVELGPGSEIRAQLSPLDAAEGFWSDIIGEPLTDLQHAALVEAVDSVFSNREITR